MPAAIAYVGIGGSGRRSHPTPHRRSRALLVAGLSLRWIVIPVGIVRSRIVSAAIGITVVVIIRIIPIAVPVGVVVIAGPIRRVAVSVTKEEPVPAAESAKAAKSASSEAAPGEASGT